MASMDQRSQTIRGVDTRRRIRDAAMTLFRDRKSADVTVSELAEAAGVYPNQITHHFGSKDALYIDAAFGLLLLDTERLQKAGRRAPTPDALRRVLARTALTMPSTTVVVSALGLARGNPMVQPAIEAGLGLLFRRSERFLERVQREHGWTTDQGIDRATKTFWSAVFGAVLISQAGFPGGPSSVDVAATLSLRLADEN
ncbi:TetR/AcrR family transcriptional regulator C-terminal domain-containing protein [Leucobacter chromiiresistens]|uniref:DNA-binding transcriptional regulator, AcrR family n=1 Tax=Leucobacter chromiiresistens TaxID=1079994 RepID=A0A1H0Z4H7_9MICO|nr:TetR/AcrR family transcriptional regulator C-terminal domain-containing protein [Leucobacter chromiiresistens]SDQ21986.1 DNA-binding transcriptional regulator, AcrR family [Leucobacter chromiiresistens]